MIVAGQVDHGLRTALAEREQPDTRRSSTAMPGSDELELIYRTAPVGLALFDRELRFLRVNERLAEMNGASVAAHLGRTVREMAPDLSAQAESVMKRIIETGEPRLDVEIVGETPAQPGVVRTWLEQWHPVRDASGRILGVGVMVEELTERRRAERALRESEARFRNMADHAPVMIWVTDASGACTYLNREWYRVTGQAEAQALGSGWLDATHEDDRARVAALFGQANAAREPFRIEYRLRRHDGTYRWAIDAAAPRFGADGSFLGYVGSVIDITERNEAEQATKRLAERLERQIRLFDGVASTTPDFIYLFDREGRFLYANRRLLEVWGRDLQDVIGRTCRELGYEQWHHDMHMREIAQVIGSKRPIKGEVPFRAPLTGIFGVYEYIFTPVLGADGEVEVIAGTTRDVTERKQTESTLQASEQRLRLTTDAARIFCWEVDVEAGTIEWSDNAARLLDCAPCALPRASASSEFFVAPDDRPRLAAEFAQIVARRDTQYTMHFAGIDGRAWRAEGVVAYGGQGAPSKVYGITQDVTERKRTEDALREADRRKDEFLAMLAHELRNPLAPLRTSIRVLGHESLSLRGQHALRMCDRQSGQLARLVDDLLDLSRITRGDIDLRPEWVNIGMTVHHGVEIFADECARRRHTVRVVLPQEPLRIRADPVRLAQIVENLLHNACKYTPDGGDIRIEAEGDDTTATIRVVDTGIGVDPAKQASIFELFTQIDRTADSSQGGLGIGLALVRRLAELHGGRVGMCSAGLGKGSTFTVVLPRGHGNAG